MSSLLSFLTKLEPDLGKLEGAYHKHNLKTDIAQTLFGLVFFNVLSLFFLRSDFLFHGPGRIFNLLLALRLGFLVLSIWAFLRLPAFTSPHEYRRLTLFLLILVVLMLGYVDILRPAGYAGFIPASIVTILAIYLINPLSLTWRVAIALFLTALDFYSLSIKGINDPSWTAITVSYLGTNLMGAMISVWINSHKRSSFLQLEKERQARRKLEELTKTDPLTRVKNRRFFIFQGKHEWERANRYGRPLTVAVMDLDGLKDINDTYGHLAGDRALLSFVKLVQKRIRKIDIFARLGGDEFGLIMPETTRQNARLLVERLLRDLQGSEVKIAASKIAISFSAGLVEKKNHDSLKELMDEADKNLYRAKRKGGNCLVC